MKNENEKNDAKQDLLIIDAETGLLSHPGTLECVSPNSGIIFQICLGLLARESPYIISADYYSLQMFACMEAQLKIYALLASV